MGSRSCNSVRLSFLPQSHLVIPLILSLLTADLLGAKVKVIWLSLIRILDITVFRKNKRNTEDACLSFDNCRSREKADVSGLAPYFQTYHQVVNYST